jgi:xanthine dehydrogenase accessory factor
MRDMREVLELIQSWSRQDPDLPVYLGTVTYIEGSAVRGAGATMAVSPRGELSGSVSGGCIESTVYSEAVRVRQKGTGRAITFCSNDDDDLAGTPAPCGGTVGVVVYPADPAVAAALDKRLREGLDERWGVITEGSPEMVGISFTLDEEDRIHGAVLPGGGELSPEALGELQTRLSGIHGPGFTELGDMKAFLMYRPAVPHLCIAGGSHIGSSLLRIAKETGWRVSVVDPREIFAEERRFAAADKLLHEWPAEGFSLLGVNGETAVAALTHNESMDDEAVAEALRRGCYYIGVLGSRTTFAERRERLLERGFDAEQVRELHGPIGLDIKAATPEEIAISIMAEVVYTYRIRYGKKA